MHERFEAKQLTSNYILSRQTQKSVLNKHFKQQFNGLEKGGQLTDASQSNATETVIMIIYYGSYVEEPRSIHC